MKRYEKRTLVKLDWILKFGLSIAKSIKNKETNLFMDKNDLKRRTKMFALRIMKLVEHLPNNRTGQVIANQILRSGTSVSANYRAACRARSKADFISKITIVEEESDETQFWLEIIIESGLISESKVKDLYNEASELTAIFTSSGKTAKINKNLKQKI
jgi:four helix bundle protein